MKRSMMAAVSVLAVLMAIQSAAKAVDVYNSMPTPYPYNPASLGYQATSTAEFGDYIGLAGTARSLTTVSVAMSDWAVRSDYMTEIGGVWTPKPGYEHVVMTSAGFNHDLTLNLYTVVSSGSVPVVGTTIASKTISAFIPWRPAATQFKADGVTLEDHWTAPNGSTYHGSQSTVTFDFTGNNVTLPDELVFGLAYNTNTYGAAPIGKSGPYESLNFACDVPVAQVGIDVNPNAVMWNTSYAGFYTDLGVGGTSTFRQDTNWAGNVPAIQIVAVPEPATMSLLALGGIATLIRRRRRA